MFFQINTCDIRTIKRIVGIVLGLVLGLYLGIIILLNVPAVQHKLAMLVTGELKKVLKTELSIGRIDIGLLNRIIIDDVILDDQSGKEMLKVTRLSAKFDILPLFKGKIAISSVQLFGFNINLNKSTSKAIPNYQFVIDALSSKDKTKKKSPLDLRINSIIVRRGRLAYDIFSEPETPGRFNSKHVKLYNIIANISLKALKIDSINGSIKRLSFDEQSGFELQKLSLRILANQKKMKIENFTITLPGTKLRMDTIVMNYDSMKAFKHFVDQVRFSFHILPSHVTLADISPFVPALSNFKDRLQLEMILKGTVDQLNCPRLIIKADKNIKIEGDVSLQDLTHIKDAYLFGHLSKLRLDSKGIEFLYRNLSKKNQTAPPILTRLGNIFFNGEVSGYFNDLVTYGNFHTDLGSFKTDVKISSNKTKGFFSYSGAVKADQFEIGKLLAKEDILGKITFNLDVKGMQQKNQLPSIFMKGLVSSVEYSKYEYKNIELDGEYVHGGFDGKIAINDANGSVQMNGSFNLTQKIPTFNVHADIRKVRPFDLHLSNKYKDSEFSLKVDANFTGSSIDDMIGEINIDSILFTSPDKHYFLDNFNISASHDGKEKLLTLNSQFLKGTVKGIYSYETVPASILKTVERYIPSLLSVNKKNVEPHNDFNFDIHIYNTEILSEVFNIPISVYNHSTIKGYFNDNARKIRIEGYFPSFKYGSMFFESGMILCENPSDQFRCRIRASNRLKKGSTLNMSLEALAKDDKVHTSFNWGNNAEVTYSGTFSAVTNFFKTQGKKPQLQAVVEVEPSDVIFNDTVWKVSPSHIVVDSGRVYVDNFQVLYKEQFLRINGQASDNIKDTVKVSLNDINIGYVFDAINLKAVDFKGMATGTLFVNRALKSPIMNTKLFVKNFAFNNGLLGDMNIYGEWDKEKEGVFLKANIKEKNISESNVTGYIFPGKKALDLDIQADSINAKFLEYYVKSIVSNIKGRATGRVRLFGTFSELNLEGSVMADASFKVNILNTSFALKDSVYLSPNEFSFKNVSLRDLEGHRGVANGSIQHKHFKNMSYRLQVNANNMLVFNTKESADLPFYGTVYGTGNALLTGNSAGLNVDVAMTTNRNTSFVYMMSNTTSAASNQFVKFVDKTPKRAVQDSIHTIDYYINKDKDENKTDMDVRLNLQIDATPEGTIKIIVDPVAGDYISGKGNGNIRLEYYNKGGVKMFGNYTLDQGVYKFSLQEVIRKDFSINSGSTISFNGNPYDANLDIKAIYTVNSASLTDLGTDIVQEVGGQTNVKVNCIMDISGVLLKPTIKLSIELPNESEEKQRAVQNIISTDDQMNMQILYLLGIGKFYTPDYANTTQSSNTMSSVLSSTLSGQLNRMFSQIIDNNNWNFGTNLSTGNKGWSDVEVQGMLSGQLLNNRLLINGNFGYRDNPTATTNFVGDFDLEYLLTKSGEIRLKAYNQTNDRYYTKTTLTTQGIGIVYKKEFNGWKDLFTWKKFKKAKAEQAKSATVIRPDSVTTPQSKKKRNR